MARPPRLDRLSFLISCLATLLACATPLSGSAAKAVLHLKSGDRVSGDIISEDASRIVVSNRWTPNLSVPLAEITRREPAATTIASAKTPAVTNTVAATKSPARPITALPPPPAYLKGETQVGLDVLYGNKDRQNYFGRLRLAYEQPYQSEPKKFFKNAFDYRADYGRTEGVKSSDRMYGSDKTDFDLTTKWYLYNLMGVGYDSIRKIDLQYEIGPGAGYHLITRPTFRLNLESGFNYQAQYRRDSEDVEDFFFRLADEITWQITPRATFTKRVEFFPRVDLSEYRARFEANLGYQLWRNISWNFTVLDLYDTRPGPMVDRNELQIRSSLGLKF